MVKKALLIGINYYNTPNQLNGCISDIQNMRNTLIDAYYYNTNDIIMLRDDQSDAKLLPTRANIISKLNELVAMSSSCDEIWFHYSGHGSQIQDLNKDEISGLDDVIVPVDYNTYPTFAKGCIVDDDLFAIIKKINKKCRAIMLFDSCHSGTVCDLPWGFEYTSGKKYLTNRTKSPLLANTNIYMFSGCKDNQTSADIYNSQTKQYVGAFTDAFLECLRVSNHTTPLLQLYMATCNYLTKNRYSQRPIFSSTNSNPNAYTISRVSSSIQPAKKNVKTKKNVVTKLNLFAKHPKHTIITNTPSNKPPNTSTTTSTITSTTTSTTTFVITPTKHTHKAIKMKFH